MLISVAVRLWLGGSREAHNHLQTMLPIGVYAHAFDVDDRGEVTKHRLGRRMEDKGRGDQEQKRRNRTNWNAGEQMSYLPALGVPPNANPVVEGLDWQVYVFLSLQFDDSELAFRGDPEQVHKVAVRPGER